ncbi:hypothetical protein CSV86_022030 [Pseudomonas putida CSV86]|uniref:Uncharacterized protein n=1 Tax=Pseudomonas bharatica CSV86 TaxID=1005395 RepID=L1LZ83_9PSED|nr:MULTISPECIES: hypothetical protein [Pseudomonas]MDG9881219.1 hypothetical protein [Pseudomonas sp. GD04058]NNJ17666.1 hypothetical protein [Pseudomonas bharatica CSV86]
MKVVLEATGKKPDRPWQVRLDQHVVGFRSEAEARAFIDTLQARIRAPHPLFRQAG